MKMSVGNENWKTGERAERIIEDLKNGRPQFDTLANAIREAEVGAATRTKALTVAALRDAIQKCGKDMGWGSSSTGHLLNYVDAGAKLVDPAKVAAQE